MSQKGKTDRFIQPAVALTLVALLVTHTPAPASTPESIYTITSTADSGVGTLRYAINQANTHPGDGYTQPGAEPATGLNPAAIVIEIDGVNLDDNNLLSSGLNITSANNLVRGLGIIRCPIHGITIGTDRTGALPIPNSIGVPLIRADYTTIGGDTPGERNLIGSQPHTFSDLGNALFGVHIHEGASENTIAGHNVIAYNTNGVLLDDEGTMENTVSASQITESDFNGIYIGGGVKANTIGPENLIRSNAADGVWIGGFETFANVVTLNATATGVMDGTSEFSATVANPYRYVFMPMVVR